MNEHLGVLSSMLEAAVRWGYLHQNPCSRVRRLKVPPREFRFYDAEQTRVFLAKSFELEPAFYSLFLTGFRTGMRPGEIQFGVHIPIERISERDLELYIRGRFDTSGVAIRDETAAQIVRLADCHPHFVQYFASEVWNLLRTGAADDAGLIPKLVDRVVSALDAGFGMFFDGPAAAQRRVVVDVALQGGDAVLAEEMRVAANLGSASTVASALDALETKEIVTRRGRTWTFVNPAFDLWVGERIARPS